MIIRSPISDKKGNIGDLMLSGSGTAHRARNTAGPDAANDEALLDHARATGQTSYHPIGTCRMGKDERAVVDAKLCV